MVKKTKKKTIKYIISSHCFKQHVPVVCLIKMLYDTSCSNIVLILLIITV